MRVVVEYGPIASSHQNKNQPNKKTSTQRLEHPQASLARENLQLIKCKIQTLIQVCLATPKSSTIVQNFSFSPQCPASSLHTVPRGLCNEFYSWALSTLCLERGGNPPHPLHSETKLQTQASPTGDPSHCLPAGTICPFHILKLMEYLLPAPDPLRAIHVVFNIYSFQETLSDQSSA